MDYFVLFDDAHANQAFCLHGFQAQDELKATQLPELDNYLQSGWAHGWHCALFADYEWGLPWQKLATNETHSGSLKIVWFKHKTAIDNIPIWLAQQGGCAPTGLSRMQWSESFADYTQKITAIQAAIARGDCYQINYTLRLKGQSYGHPIRLYARLRQKVPYAALAHLPNQTWVLCFSPELFLRIDSKGLLSTEPMKGTAPILNDGQDQQRATALRNDQKNRAENLMIVDLLRNDLGKLAQIGSVCVPEPFKVSAFGRVWQMTSEIQAQLKPQTSVAEIFQAAFPCGSITGAPKRKSMEIISKLECENRGLYTGSIGFLQPEPTSTLGFSGCLNVAIRTLTLHDNQTDGYDAIYGVGGGIVADSLAHHEYQECGWKARFITELPAEYGLFETMRADGQSIALLNKHLNRMQQSATALNIEFNEQIAHNLIKHHLSQLDKQQTYRCKLSLNVSGSLNLSINPYQALQGKQKVLISTHALPNHDPLRRHKTTYRQHWDKLWQQAQAQGAFDTLAFNQDGFLLEGGRSVVKILYKNQWITPKFSLDILNSITRENDLSSGNLKEALITQDMLINAEKICLGNALHGWFEVDIVSPTSSLPSK